MSLFHLDPRRKQDMEIAQGLDAREPNRGNYLEKKRTVILQTYEDPLLPKLCRILFFSMLAVTAVLSLAEITNFFRRPEQVDFYRFLSNLSTTGLGIWSIYSLLLAVCSAVGIWTGNAAFRRRQRESGVEDRTEEDRQRTVRANRRRNAGYRMYLIVCGTGFVLWLLFFLIVLCVR